MWIGCSLWFCQEAETAMEERRRVPEDAEWVKQLARRGAYLSLLDRCGDRPQLRRLVWRHQHGSQRLRL